MGDPTIYDWAGGREALAGWLDAFYDLVEDDDVLAPVFGGLVTREHRDHVTDLVVGGHGRAGGLHGGLGGYEHMLAKHRGLAITPEQRLRFVTLLSAPRTSRAPADPEFRAAIMGYAEWGSRLAIENSPGDASPAEHAPVPRWGWGVAPPYQPG